MDGNVKKEKCLSKTLAVSHQWPWWPLCFRSKDMLSQSRSHGLCEQPRDLRSPSQRAEEQIPLTWQQAMLSRMVLFVGKSPKKLFASSQNDITQGRDSDGVLAGGCDHDRDHA